MVAVVGYIVDMMQETVQNKVMPIVKRQEYKVFFVHLLNV